ncbi:DNA sulfur modification protein DndD [Priestia megaterium]|uniref:AAA family ATPase n=1 Tax=Priestia megaterium TaxID=1404 RepID=UPI000BF54DE0|nr:AAA family ATPase [Priestia megaterium]PFL68550.1 DNA sulfur modification protein DndD [Priestia megaterium]
MLLKSIAMKNFRQYRGEQLVEFSCDKERNVTVILGNNTSGKTTLLQAFNWCLYDKAVFDTKEFLLNLDVSREMNNGETETVEVEINLIHDNTEYIITRSQKYNCDSRGTRPSEKNVRVSYKQTDGQIEPIKQIHVDNTINKILPKDLSTYFFFDTERIGNISSKADVTEAVKGLLGLSVLDNAMKHLGSKNQRTSVIGKLTASMDLAGNEKANQALKRIQTEQLRREDISIQLETARSEIKHYEKRKEQLDEILRDNESTSKLQSEKERIERDLNHEESVLQSTYSKFLTDFNTNTVNFFAQPLMKRAMNLLKETKVDDKGVKDMNAQSIADIIKRGRCVCGTEIVNENEAYLHLMKELEFLPPHSIGTIIKNFKEKIDTYNSTNNSYSYNIQSKIEDIYRYKNRIQEWQDEVDEISKKIKGKEDMRKYEEELNDVKVRLRNFNKKKDRLIHDDGACSSEIERFQKIYDRQVSVSDKNKQVMTYIRYAEEVYNWIQSTYKEKELVIREKLETNVNNIFSKMYHGRRKVVIDEKYRVSLLTAYADDEVKTDESKGLETVKNFAFIAGLVELAREQIVSKAGSDSMALSSEPYPLVMDAPFSNADEKHVSNISMILPEVAEQVIMFVMEKDWKYAEAVMAKKVGGKYMLNKQTETLTYIRESGR